MLTIAVLHYQNEVLTKGCIQSINRQVIPVQHEKIVIDNGSTKPFPAIPSWKIYRMKNNYGNIGGQNVCFEYAQGDLVLFVSNDVRVHAHCIERMLAAFVHEGTGQVMPKLYQTNGHVDTCGMNFKWPGYGLSIRKGNRMNIAPSIIYLMAKHVWETVGGFDESLESSHEDVDMGLRLSRMGQKPVVCGEAEAIHLGNQTLKHTLSDHRKVFHQARVKVINKHYGGLDWLTRRVVVGFLDGVRNWLP